MIITHSSALVSALVLFVHTLASFGAAYILGHSTISRPAREFLWDLGTPPARWLVLLLECPACLGFWIGVAAVATGVFDFLHASRLFVLLPAACYTAGSNLILARLAGILQIVKDEAEVNRDRPPAPPVQ